jgi:pimeloyl-ACP methyl ester carboxylesterase
LPFVTVADRRIDYRWIGESEPPPLRRGGGSAERPTLIWLHEGLGSHDQWRDVPERVAAATGTRALLYSRYGYGRSERLTEPRGVRYMHDEALVALAALRDALGIENPILVGHSDGASIALIHAGAGRWPVRGVVAMAPHVFVEPESIAGIETARDVYRTTDLGKRLGRYHDDPDATFWGWNDIWLSPAFRSWNIEEYLPRISCPVLLIQGEADEYGTLAQLDAIERQVAGPAERLVLPNCGHSPHRDKPDETAEAVSRFVVALAGGAGR